MWIDIVANIASYSLLLQVSPVLSSIDDIILASKLNTSLVVPASAYTLFPSYSALVLGQMSAQQFDVVTNMQAFKIIHAVKPVVGNAVSIVTPLTATETAASVPANSMTLSTVAGTSNVKVALLVTRLSTLAPQLEPLVHSDPVLVMLSDTSVCPSTGCAFQIVLQSVDNATYKSAPSTPLTFNTQCGLSASSTVYPCGNGLNVTANCDGKSVTTLISTCGYTITAPTCGRLSASGATQDVCKMVSFTGTQTTCQCVVPTSVLTSTRRQLEISTSGFEVASVANAGKLQIGTVTSSSKVAAATTTAGTPTGAPSRGPTPAGPSASPTFSVASSIAEVSTTVIVVSVIFSVLGASIIIAGIIILVQCQSGQCTKQRRTSIVLVGS